MNFWQRYLAMSLLTFLQSTVKNPKSLEKEKVILAEIRDLIVQIIGV